MDHFKLIKAEFSMPKIETGDVVGCGINFCESEIFFTHNGNYESKYYNFSYISIKNRHLKISKFETRDENILCSF